MCKQTKKKIGDELEPVLLSIFPSVLMSSAKKLKLTFDVEISRWLNMEATDKQWAWMSAGLSHHVFESTERVT